ncbi:MAG: thioredoxin family protein [Chromatiales bacterium]|nr:thioredoxin family protein [Chromatiales bacterium]
MNVKIIATRTCKHRLNLERELRDLGIDYELVFVEEHPQEALRLGIRHSPCLVVDDNVISREVPTEHELRALFAGVK